MKGGGLVFGVLLLSLFFISFVSAEILISDVGVKYDASIIDRFENGSSSVLIWVKTKNVSPQEVFDILDMNEITLRTGHLFDDGFEGNVTEIGFNKLLNNSGVNEIYDMTTAYPSGALSTDNSSSNSNESEYQNETSNQNITLTASKTIMGINKTTFVKSSLWIFGIIVLIIILFFVIKSIIKKKTENEY